MGKVLMAGIVPKLTVPTAIPPEPALWTFYQAISTDTEWTPPNAKEWYRVWVIGKSGDGCATSWGAYNGSGYGGGGSGGVAGSVLLGSDIGTVSCVVNSTQTSFGDFMTATAGSTPTGKSGGAAGTATGGNLYNLTGYQGGAGSRGTGGQGGNNGMLGGYAGNTSFTDQDGDDVTGSAGGGGGGGARLPVPYDGFPYIATSLTAYRAGGGGGAYCGYKGTHTPSSAGKAATAYPSLDLTAPMLYGGGGGGGCYGQDNNHVNGNNYYSTGVGGAASSGSPGLIIIERGATA